MKRIDSVSFTWIPEDDLLLKNSLEVAGASLESLAKGAVKFSCGFTLRELRDRWHSLLYDPAVSDPASPRMIKFQQSGSNSLLRFSKLDDLRGSEKAPEKRKGGSIRTQYYAMRKRIKNENFNPPNLGSFEKCNNHNYSRHGHSFQDHITPNHEAQVGDAIFGDCLDNNFGFEETEIEILRQAFPESIVSISTTTAVVDKSGCHNSVENNYINESMREDGSYKLTENVRPLLINDLMGFFDPGIEPESDTHIYKDDSYADLPFSLFNFSNKDDVLYMHVVAKDMMDDIPKNSQMLDSSKNVPEDSLCNADVTTLLIASTSISTSNVQCQEESKASSFHDQPDASHWEADSLQLIEGKIICTLNTEDPEIPCNDDIFLLIHPSTSFAFSIKPEIVTDSIDPLSSSADEKDGEPGLSAGEDLDPSFIWSQMDGSDLLSEFNSAHPHVGYAFKSESSDTKSFHPLFGPPDKIRNFGQSRSTHTHPVLIGDGVLTENGIDTLGAEVGSLKMIDSEAMDNPFILDHDNSDSDSDIPNFSDIEAMILEMDFAYAQESCITSEVARNQYNHSKRMIIRLEQTARSSLQRAMSSLGAFAIFYGRHFNYYIKKTEVTIGRSTDDTDVDIDLRKEGRANMISRRQATIKMETDGSFTLKNLGKSSISMNGNSIARGQVAALSSSCLIEIRGMCFMFEINDKYVRRYLDDIIKKSQGNCKTFEWTPE